MHTAEAYEAREVDGYSPEATRDWAWRQVGALATGRLLDVGLGDGNWARRLLASSPARLTCVDLVRSGASSLIGVDFHVANLSTDPLPVPSESVDLVTAIEVVEHLANPRHFVTEAYRVLAPGGTLFVTTPNCDSLRARLSLLVRGYFPAFCDHDYVATGHITPILAIDLRRMAGEAGFREVTFSYPPSGQIPMTPLKWQRLAPWLRGCPFSDTLSCRMVR